jgi:hypothetical protein
VEAIRSAGNRHGNQATASSPAMRELADEAAYVEIAADWAGPVADTHVLGALTLWAAADYVRVFAEAFAAARPPVWGHLAVARSALESSVASWWLNEPGIARDQRVKRGLSEYLYSAVEEERLGLDKNAAAHVDEWLARASRLRWAVTDTNGKNWTHTSRGKPRVGGVTRPSIAVTITKLLVDNDAADIGAYEWSRLSAVSHVTWFGLSWAIDRGAAAPSSTPGMATASYGTNTRSVGLQGLCMLRALRQAATARATLMGWDDDRWRSDARVGEEYESRMVEAFAQTRHLGA